MSPSTFRVFATAALLAGTIRLEEPWWKTLIRYAIVVICVIVIRSATVVEESKWIKPRLYDPKGLTRFMQDGNKEGE